MSSLYLGLAVFCLFIGRAPELTWCSTAAPVFQYERFHIQQVQNTMMLLCWSINKSSLSIGYYQIKVKFHLFCFQSVQPMKWVVFIYYFCSQGPHASSQRTLKYLWRKTNMSSLHKKWMWVIKTTVNQSDSPQNRFFGSIFEDNLSHPNNINLLCFLRLLADFLLLNSGLF
jgi:hypothetical protein